MKTFDELVSIVRQHCTQGDVSADETMTPKGVKVSPADLRNLCASLREDPLTFFDTLSCLTVVDNGADAGTFDIVYNLYSIPFNHHLAVKVVLPRDTAEVDTVQDVWRTANWHEREAWDMFGVKFKGHPDLRRILMPADWDGHPLRRDYKQQEYYRGVKVEY
jgi:NADH-quinone oxidoreductase subunit C